MLMRTLMAAAVATAVAFPANAQDAQEGASGEETVLATVNGKAVTAADVAFAYETLGETIARLPAENREETVLNLLIDMELLADAAEERNFDDDPVFEQRMAYLRSQMLRDLYMERVIDQSITETMVRERYEEEAANLQPQTEVSARHILVEFEEKANELIRELQLGADFATLAEEHSKDPGSAQRGGSLGFFGPGQMVPAFEEAAFSLEEGAFTQEPVESRFGWHVIKVDEKRERPVPAFDEVKDQIRQVMIREAFVEELERLKAEATIEMGPAADGEQ